MIFRLKPTKDDLIQSAYDSGIQELNDFWGINWINNKPNIFLFDSRKEIDEFKGTKTEPWVVGWANNGNIYLLNFEKLGIESSKEYTREEYSMLVKHELAHLYYKSRSGGKETPRWLNEGLSLYLSGQLKTKEKPNELVGFINFFSEGGARIYDESGFVVELLVNKFGKDKMIQLVKQMVETKNEDDFNKKFKEIYGFELSYIKINELYSKEKAPN